MRFARGRRTVVTVAAGSVLLTVVAWSIVAGTAATRGGRGWHRGGERRVVRAPPGSGRVAESDG